MKHIRRMMVFQCLPLVAALSLAGCATMAPKYSQPAAPVPGAWPSGPAYKDVTGKPADKAMADISWQEFFVDPQLRIHKKTLPWYVGHPLVSRFPGNILVRRAARPGGGYGCFRPGVFRGHRATCKAKERHQREAEDSCHAFHLNSPPGQ